MFSEGLWNRRGPKDSALGRVSDYRVNGRIGSQGQAVAEEEENQVSVGTTQAKPKEKRVLRKREWPSLLERGKVRCRLKRYFGMWESESAQRMY